MKIYYKIKEYYNLYLEYKALKKDVRKEIARENVNSWYGLLSLVLFILAATSFSVFLRDFENLYLKIGVWIILFLAAYFFLLLGVKKKYIAYKEKEGGKVYECGLDIDSVNVVNHDRVEYYLSKSIKQFRQNWKAYSFFIFLTGVPIGLVILSIYVVKEFG